MKLGVWVTTIPQSEVWKAGAPWGTSLKLPMSSHVLGHERPKRLELTRSRHRCLVSKTGRKTENLAFGHETGPCSKYGFLDCLARAPGAPEVPRRWSP